MLASQGAQPESTTPPPPPHQRQICDRCNDTGFKLTAGVMCNLTLSYSSEINAVFCPQRVSLPLKNTLWYVLRGLCCPSSLVQQPLQIKTAVWHIFSGIWTFRVGWGSPLQTVMAVWHTSNFKIGCQIAITICRGLPHPTRSLSRIVCRGQDGTKGSKGTLRPDFWAYTWPVLFKS